MRVGSIFLSIVLFSMLSFPASAAYEWNNEITLHTEGMIWEYTEKYSDNRSIIFKAFIDAEFGDNDGFVSAWELLKTDVQTTKAFFSSIEDKMDVKIDNSSKNITLLSVESNMSSELIGPINEERDIVNNYQVFYDFKKPLKESDSSMWFQGEPETDVTINLPSEINFISIDGIDDEFIIEDSYGTHISGEFGFIGEITMNISAEALPVQDKDVTELFHP